MGVPSRCFCKECGGYCVQKSCWTILFLKSAQEYENEGLFFVRFARLSGVGYRLSPYATNPSFVAFLNYLHIRVTSVCAEFATLINTQECHARSCGVFFGKLCSHGVRSLIDLRNEYERTTGLHDS